MKYLILILLILSFGQDLISQSKINCEYNYFRLRDTILVDGEFPSIKKFKHNKFIKCYSSHYLSINVDDYFFSNILQYISQNKDQKKRSKLIDFLIKIQPVLDNSIKSINGQYLKLILKSSDSKFGKISYSNRIEKNFDRSIYYYYIFLFAKKLPVRMINEIREEFQEDTMTLSPNVKIINSRKWLSALALAKCNDLGAISFLKSATEYYIKNVDRAWLNQLGADIASTRNRELINFLIDEYLMSDYSVWDFDTGHDDYSSVINILNSVIESNIIVEILSKYNDSNKSKEVIRQWFKDHRETYKIKP